MGIKEQIRDSYVNYLRGLAGESVAGVPESPGPRRNVHDQEGGTMSTPWKSALYRAFEAGWFDNHRSIADAWPERLPDLMEAPEVRALVHRANAYEGLRAALERLVDTSNKVTVFVTSRERIKDPEGTRWWSEEREIARRTLDSLEAS